MTAVIGKNGVGKSALVDAFGFLSDALNLGVEGACYARERGGFQKIRALGQSGPIEFEIYYREDSESLPIHYHIIIEEDELGHAYVSQEVLGRGQVEQKQKLIFLFMTNGSGHVGKEYVDGFDISEWTKWRKEEKLSKDVEWVELEDRKKLCVSTFGNLKKHPQISAFLRFVEGWHLSYFIPDAARDQPLAGPQKHLSIRGDNLGNVVQFMEREHPRRFQAILKNIAGKIPGIDRIDTERTIDGRLLLRFNDKGFQDPFYAQQMSDGTLKIFAYLLLLEDPSPPPFLCIEEPENGLYHKLLETLAHEFREHSQRQDGSQIFITTHQPYLVDALEPNEVWILEKGADGFSTIRRASDDPLVNNMVAEGLPLGGLWYSDYLDPR